MGIKSFRPFATSDGPSLTKNLGFCVYCPGSGTTSDHVVPLALGGKHILQNGSCERCRSELNKSIDQPVLRNFLGTARLQFEVPRSTKRPPSPVRVTFNESNDGFAAGKAKDEYLDPSALKDLPRHITRPVVSRPGLLTGEKNSVHDSILIRTLSHYIERDYHSKLRALTNAKRAEMISINDYLLFLRMLAKIGHAVLHLVLPRDAFSPLLLDIIHGGDDEVLRYVGGGGEMGTRQDDYYFSVREKASYLVVRIQLFSKYGLHGFDVVAGKRTSETR